MDDVQLYSRGFNHMPLHGANDTTHLLGMAVFLIVAIIGMYFIYRIFSGSNMAHHIEDPLEIAKLRYAKGEIKKDELDAIRKELKG